MRLSSMICGRKNGSVRLCIMLCATIMLSSCTNMLFVPSKQFYYTPDVVDVDYDNVYITSADSTRLHGWRLKTEQARKGNVLYLHGNGENISTHFANLYWLLDYGYDGYIFDYRGYGLSEGEPDLDGAVSDVAAMLDYIIEQSNDHEQVIVIGHSMGGALAIYSVATSELKDRLTALVSIETFSDYRDITQDVLSNSWLTWLLQWPLSYTMDNSYSPVEVIDQVSPLPLLIMHSRRDLMIDYYHAERLYEAAAEPKQLVEIDSDHNHIFRAQGNRELLMDFIDSL